MFEKNGVDAYFEIMFLAVESNYGKRQIGYDCVKYSVDIARELYNGKGFERVSKSLHNIKPKGCGAMWTSSYSAKIGKALGFKVLNVIPFTEFSFNGKTFNERIGPIHPVCEHVFYKF